MIAHALNMCAPYILCTFDLKLFLELLNLDITSTPPLECLHCLFVCNLQFKPISFLYIFKLCIMIVHPLKMCTDDAGPEQSLVLFSIKYTIIWGPLGVQLLSGRVLVSKLRGWGFEPHRRHCIVSLSKTH